MGGIDWQAIETVAEIFGFRDIELFVAQLTTIRDWQKKAEND